MNRSSIAIIGAGLGGSLLALRLGQLGMEVHLFERRPDMRKEKTEAGRSINLALSPRGLNALEKAGVRQQAEALCISMPGRMIHMPGGELTYMPYSGRNDKWINSISRGGLNELLLDEAERLPNVKMYFGCRCERIDYGAKTAWFLEEASGTSFMHQSNVYIGTDGAGSAVRNSMMGLSSRIRFNYSQSFLSHGYKELSIPSDKDGGFQMEKHALHIWPRGSQMLIALPNLDGSFTVTLFQDFDGAEGFVELNSAEKARIYFEKYYSDALKLMPEFDFEFFNNPTSSLGTFKCYPWAVDGISVLLGDAAHAVVPFYGQGMNCTFEDVAVLDDLISEHGYDWPLLIDAFQKSRKPNADAIADLAVDNFYEMRDKTSDPVFQMKSQVEKELEKRFEDYDSKYSKVTFRPDLSYFDAMVLGRAQDDYLMNYCKNLKDLTGINWEALKSEVQGFANTVYQDTEKNAGFYTR
jgi:kynurenine 3-monooxygenase